MSKMTIIRNDDGCLHAIVMPNDVLIINVYSRPGMAHIKLDKSMLAELKAFLLSIEKENLESIDDLVKGSIKNDQSYKLFAASSRAMAISEDGNQIGLEKYPWRSLPVGKSFIVDTRASPVKLQTLQSSASRWSKKLGKRFRVVDWPENGTIEVARLPDAES